MTWDIDSTTTTTKILVERETHKVSLWWYLNLGIRNVRIKLNLDFLDFWCDWSPRSPLLLPFCHFFLGSYIPYLNKLNAERINVTKISNRIYKLMLQTKKKHRIFVIFTVMTIYDSCNTYKPPRYRQFVVHMRAYTRFDWGYTCRVVIVSKH